MYLLNPFHGRIGRGQWWLLQLAIFGFAIVGMILTILVFADPTAPTGSRNSSENAMLVLILAAMVYMNFSACLNRLRDSGRSGFVYIAFLLPAVGTGLMIYFCGLEGGNGNSQSSRPNQLGRRQNFGLSTG